MSSATHSQAESGLDLMVTAFSVIKENKNPEVRATLAECDRIMSSVMASYGRPAEEAAARKELSEYFLALSRLESAGVSERLLFVEVAAKLAMQAPSDEE